MENRIKRRKREIFMEGGGIRGKGKAKGMERWGRRNFEGK